jgi:hypothetical protein
MPHTGALAAATVKDEPAGRQASAALQTGIDLPGDRQPVSLTPAPAGGSLPLFASLVGALIASVGGYITFLTNRSRQS